MYKKIIAEIIKAENIFELDGVCAVIDRAFEKEAITYKEHEQLLDLVCKVSGGYYTRPGVKAIDPNE